MKNQYTIFYSWQSDISKNRNDINNCIEKSIKSLSNAGDIKLDLNLDRDTKNRTGSPSITETIFNKISQCDVFICDVTLVNNSWLNRINNARVTPNPNVLIELGYAISKLGWERIICINNTYHGKNELLPFDIRGHRITAYNIKDSDYKGKLTKILKSAISVIIDDYPAILNRHKLQGYLKHDKGVYDTIMSICNETRLKEGISHAYNDLFTSDYYYYAWDSLIEFYNSTTNHFVDEDIDAAFKSFLGHLDKFRMICAKYFHPTELSKTATSKTQYEEAGIEITPELLREINQSHTYAPNKEPFSKEDWGDRDKRLGKLQEDLYVQGKETTDAFESFIKVVKTKISAR